MNNICIAVCTCKNKIKSAIEYNNFIKDYTDNYFFYHGESEINNLKFKCLYTSDCYSKLTLKTYKMLAYSLNFNYDHLIKIDDDTFLNFTALKSADFKNVSYGGNLSSLENHLLNFEKYKNYLISQSYIKDISFNYSKKLTKNFKYVQGNFCILSRDTIIKILNAIKEDTLYKDIPQEDISIGYICSKINVPPVDLNSKNLPYYHTTPFSIHPVKPILLKKLFKLSNINDIFNECRQNIYMNKYFTSGT